MLVGREAECRQLEDIYGSERNNLIVLYGRRGIGKTMMVQEFIKEKPAIYYKARECTEKEQLYLFAKELKFPEGIFSMEFGYEDLLVPTAEKLMPEGEKVVIVIDEFHLIAADSLEFLRTFVSMMAAPQPMMFIFLTSSIHWVENDMVKKLGPAAKCITSFMKIKELPFTDIVEFFPKSNVEQCIYLNAAIGGVPKYMKMWQDGKSVKDNIIRMLFQPESPLYLEAESFLKTELRELKAYNTILAALAAGRIKLNDIYEYTNFSRAKISVYIKNLIQLDIVEKLFSYEAGDKENSQKGLYRIKDNFINFWYRFVYPYQSMIETGKGKEVYENYFLPESAEYMRIYYAGVCEEFLKLLSQLKRLSYEYSTWGRWYGKNGILDVVGSDEEGHYVAAVCSFDERLASIKLLKQARASMKDAGIKDGEIYLFSKNGFTKEMHSQAQNEENIVLIELKDL